MNPQYFIQEILLILKATSSYYIYLCPCYHLSIAHMLAPDGKHFKMFFQSNIYKL
jgi:hypothetical protein